MLVGEATATVTVAPSEVFAFVLDLNRYRQADRKIGKVGRLENDTAAEMVRFKDLVEQ